jgi:hypothetical protein
MRHLRKVISRFELSKVYDEGKKAFEEDRRPSANPYVSTNQELAMEWWHGWDTAEEESRSKRIQPGGRL